LQRIDLKRFRLSLGCSSWYVSARRAIRGVHVNDR
jgi:hypothetical protein